jgi:ribosomal protein S11
MDVHVLYPLGTEDVTASTVQVYPNPTAGILKVSNTRANRIIRITDVTGSVKGTYSSQEGTTTVDLTGYAKGTYMVQYDGKSYKVIKK